MTARKVRRSNSLRLARKKFFERCETTGSICPCCDKFGVFYDRVFNSGMAGTLVWVYFHARKRYVHMPSHAPKHVTNSREYGKIKHWGLMIDRPNEDPAKKHSGYWRITPKGIQFARAEIRIAARMVEYNNEPLLFYGRRITLRSAFNKKFDYSELWASRGLNKVKLTT